MGGQSGSSAFAQNDRRFTPVGSEMKIGLKTVGFCIKRSLVSIFAFYSHRLHLRSCKTTPKKTKSGSEKFTPDSLPNPWKGGTFAYFLAPIRAEDSTTYESVHRSLRSPWVLFAEIISTSGSRGCRMRLAGEAEASSAGEQLAKDWSLPSGFSDAPASTPIAAADS